MLSAKKPYFDCPSARRERIQILASVEFGMPSKNCRNFGVCRIDALKDIDLFNRLAKEPDLTSVVIALLTLDNSDSTELELSVFRSTISNAAQSYFFSKDSFLVQEEFHFSPDMLSYLGCQELRIPEGNYSIEFRKSSINIQFHKLFMAT